MFIKQKCSNKNKQSTEVLIILLTWTTSQCVIRISNKVEHKINNKHTINKYMKKKLSVKKLFHSTAKLIFSYLKACRARFIIVRVELCNKVCSSPEIQRYQKRKKTNLFYSEVFYVYGDFISASQTSRPILFIFACK